MSILWSGGRYSICKIMIAVLLHIISIHNNIIANHKHNVMYMTVRITIIMQVNTNGVVSFGATFIDHYSRPFPLSTSDILIAPFWDNYFYGRQVLFRLSDSQTLLNKVGSIIHDTLEFDFTPTMLFIVTWSGIPEFYGSQNIV